MKFTDLNLHFNPGTRQHLWSELLTHSSTLADKSRNASVIKKAHTTAFDTLRNLSRLETLWAFPGCRRFSNLYKLLDEENFEEFYCEVKNISHLIDSREYRRVAIEEALGHASEDVHYFEVLVVSSSASATDDYFSKTLGKWASDQDEFVYKVVVVSTLAEALVAILMNYDIQSVIVQDEFSIGSGKLFDQLVNQPALKALESAICPDDNPALMLGKFIRDIRPELDLFLSTTVSPTKLAGTSNYFSRLFHYYENTSELHLSILKAVGRRYKTPFFDALKTYSREPVGAFHALPVSRGNSVFRSPWMKDFHDFYGSDIFLAESSATTGGLDSLLQPTGTLQQAQTAARICFGSKDTFFVTAGTSVSNKVVHQALTKDGDIVLMDRSAHESHHMALLVTGASPYYLTGYSLDKYSVAGAVPLKQIKKALIELDAQGLLDRVKLITLTNCTFDGLAYNVEKYMEEILAIIPDVVFLWDEAWFAFARFVPSYRQRTAMHVADRLRQKFDSDEYREHYKHYKTEFLSKHPKPDDAWIEQPLLADPDKARLRVYSTQSTHKTLSSFRQGSMIHIWDEDFNKKNSDQFNKAYLTHTTTSPNYQILASLDVARRQVHLEGYELVQRSIEMALIIRNAINSHPSLNSYFYALGPEDLIPEEYRNSNVAEVDPDKDAQGITSAWSTDDFVLDPCRITVYIGQTGVDGFTFRTEYLAKRCNIQVNKTGLNSICIMTNIGTTRSSVAYLIESLIRMAKEFADNDRDFSTEQCLKFRARRERVTRPQPLPDFSSFHPKFATSKCRQLGQIRQSYFEGYEPDNVYHCQLNELQGLLDKKEPAVAATYIIPVPPGFPILVPGQLLDKPAVDFLMSLNPGEIIGLDAELGVRFFKQEYLGDNAAKVAEKDRSNNVKAAKSKKEPVKINIDSSIA